MTAPRLFATPTDGETPSYWRRSLTGELRPLPARTKAGPCLLKADLPTGSWEARRDRVLAWHLAEGAPWLARAAAEVDADPIRCAVAFSRTTNRCCCCSRRLQSAPTAWRAHASGAGAASTTTRSLSWSAPPPEGRGGQNRWVAPALRPPWWCCPSRVEITESGVIDIAGFFTVRLLRITVATAASRTWPPPCLVLRALPGPCGSSAVAPASCGRQRGTDDRRPDNCPAQSIDKDVLH
jgi:hypothetical protein